MPNTKNQDIIAPLHEPLAKFLHRQYKAAQLSPGTAIRRQLKRGLRIDMMISDNMLRLQLHREGRAPSITEWKTILKYLGFTHQPPDNCYLAGDFPLSRSNS